MICEQTEKEFLNEIDCLLKEDKTEQAIKQMTQSFFRDKVQVLKRLGNAHIRLEDYDLASEIFRYLFTLKLDEQDKCWIIFNTAIIFRETNQIDKAKKILHKLILDYPKNSSYLCELGNCFFDSEEFDLAEKYFLEAIKNLENTTDNDHNKAQIYSYTAWFFKETKRIEIAIKLFKKALFFLPIHKNFLLWLADCYEELEQNKKAKEFYEKAKDYFPEDYMIQEYVEEKLEGLEDS